MDRKLFIFGATLLLSFFISHNRALPVRPYDPTTIDRFVHDVEKFHVGNVDKEKFDAKVSDDVMNYLYMWEHIHHNWMSLIYVTVSIRDGVDSTAGTSAANEVPSADDRKKASELIREFTEDLEIVNRPQLNSTRFNEIANKLSPALILADLLEWKASKDAMLKTIYDFIMADGAKSEDSSKNLLNFMNRQYVSIISLNMKAANLPIPVDTTAFKEKANVNATLVVNFSRAHGHLRRTKMMQTIYSIVVNGSNGLNSTEYMKNYISSSKYNVYWLPRKNPFPRGIIDFVGDLSEIKWTMDINIALFEEKANIDPALTTEFLNLYLLSTKFNIFQEESSIVVNGAEGMTGAEYMEHFLQNLNDAALARKQ